MRRCAVVALSRSASVPRKRQAQGTVDRQPGRCVHLCVDMQRLLEAGSPWHTPWLPRVLPQVERMVAANPGQTIFTRFMPPRHAADAQGAWRRYFSHWHALTRSEVEPSRLELLPSLARWVSPALQLDKPAYSPFYRTTLHQQLQARGCETLLVSGAETDICVLATVLDAVDRGYRVVVVVDAICSSSDATHDALLRLYKQRFSLQVRTTSTASVLALWQSAARAAASGGLQAPSR